MFRLKAALIAGLAIASTSVGAFANTLSFQGINFTLTNLGGGELEFKLSAVTGNSITASASGDWTGIKYLNSFALKPAGGTYTGATLAGWTDPKGGLNAHGCSGSGAGWLCFDHV